MLLVITTTLGPVGCKYLEFDTIALRKGIGHFSFEYSKRYQLGLIEVRDDYTNVNLSGPYLGDDMISPSIRISIRQSAGEPDPEAAADDMIEWAGKLQDFQLIDRSAIVISGQPGVQVVWFNVTPPTIGQIAVGIGPHPSITRKAIFVHGSHLWTITMIYNTGTPEEEERYEAALEHVLKTFKILE